MKIKGNLVIGLLVMLTVSLHPFNSINARFSSLFCLLLNITILIYLTKSMSLVFAAGHYYIMIPN